MASAYAKEANDAFVDDSFEAAVDLFTKAIDLDPTNADFFADRAQAHIKLGNLVEAVSDATKAIELDPSMAKAYLRKGTACMKLKEYQTAKETLERGAPLAKDTRFSRLIEECREHIPVHLIEEPKETTSAVPSNESPKIVELKESDKGQDRMEQNNVISIAKPKYRHEFYQSPERVVVSIFAKRVPANCITVEFGEQLLSVSIQVPGEDAYNFQPRLFAKIIPEKCKYDVFSTKVEIRLAKLDSSIQWKTLEYSKESSLAPPKANVSSVGLGKPVYPSSKNPYMNWDKLEAEVKKEEKEEKLDGDAAVNKLFRDIFQNADEDMRRAMIKSYQESNGTVLSTNWKDVGAKKIDASPPDGMELKKWEM